ncbi:MAG: ABC transporter permease [Desulfurococcaceae archaeon]|jgi:ABC-2 type transport system permease protein|nr:ABC transporter permease [Desulfurococcaceae archaeon]
MRTLWRTLGAALLNFTVFRRQWMWIVQNIMFSLGVLLLALGWGGSAAVRVLIPVYIVISGWGFGLNIIAQFVGYDRISKEWERLVASPLKLVEYFIGLTVGTSPPLLTGILVLMVLMVVWGFDLTPAVVVALPVSLIAMVLGAFLSLAIVLRIRNPVNISAVTNPLATLTTFLPPVLYPPAMIPEPLRTASVVVPTVALAEVTKFLSLGVSTLPVELCTASIVVWLVVTAIATLKVLKWGLE